MHVCMYVFMECMHVCMNVCMYVSMYRKLVPCYEWIISNFYMDTLVGGECSDRQQARQCGDCGLLVVSCHHLGQPSPWHSTPLQLLERWGWANGTWSRLLPPLRCRQPPEWTHRHAFVLQPLGPSIKLPPTLQVLGRYYNIWQPSLCSTFFFLLIGIFVVDV